MMPAELIAARARITNMPSAAISLVRSGVRLDSRRNSRPGRAARLSAPSSVMAYRPALSRKPPHVPDAAQGVDQPRFPGVHLAPQHGHVRLPDAGVAAEVVVPHVIEDLHLGQHPVGVAHEVPEQLELGGGELDLLAGPPHLMAFLVEFEVGEREPGRRLDSVPPGPPKYGADPRDHLFEAERLGD